MGYSTDFVGPLYFTCPMTEEMLGKLESYFGEDTREHKEWKVPLESYGSPCFYYIDIKTNKTRNGIEWDGSEKTYGMTQMVQFLLDEMRTDYPQFGLIGVMEAQGEEVGDHWFIVADGDKIMEVDARDYYVNYEGRLKAACKAITDGNASIEATIS